MTIPPEYINKNVSFRFSGKQLTFNLSHGLFSSFDIDSGSKLLLKSIAKHIELDGLRSVLDIGCGIGVLGVSLKKRVSSIALEMRDRDALAVLFSEANAIANGIENPVVRGELSLIGLEGERYDLIVSNFPAKAGGPLLESFIRRSSAYLSPGGRVAVVVVTPLAEIVRRTIEEAGGTVFHHESTANYAVFHFRTEPEREPEDFPLYIRHRGDFTLQDRTYSLETVYNLPDFDTPGYAIQGAAKLLKGRVLKGQVLFWKPGQGHLPVYLAAGSGKKTTAEVTIASNDLLELRVTARNLTRLRPDYPLDLHHLPYLASINNVVSKAFFDSFFVDLNPIPGVNWQKELWEAAGYALKSGGTLFISGRTSELSAIEKRHHGYSLLDSGKFRGFRNIVLNKL